MSKITEKLYESGYLTDKQLEKIGRNTAEMVKAIRENPELAKEAADIVSPLSKGNFWDTAKSMLLWTGLATGAAAAVRGGEALIRGGVNAVADSINKSRYYKKMLDTNPGLRDQSAERVQQAFDTLYKFNPVFASDPSVAGSAVTQLMDYGAPHVNAKDLVSAHKQIVETRERSAPDIGRMVPSAPMSMFQAPSGPTEEQSELWRAQAEKTRMDIERMREKGNS